MRTGEWLGLLVVAAVVVGSDGQATGRVTKRPNILVFLADDLGIGDLGCYGNDTIKTPNIDRLASEGVRLTHHLSASALCTPSRASLLTGRYPVRYGLEEGLSPITAPVIVHITSDAGLPADEVTIADALTAANYTTGLVGKWHLGMNCTLFGRSCPGPLNYGFQSFFGIPVTLFQEFRGPHVFWRFPMQETKFQGLAVTGVLAVITVILVCRMGLVSQWLATLLLLTTCFLLFGVWFVFAHLSVNSDCRWGVSPWFFRFANSRLLRGDQVVEAPIQLDGLSQRLVEESRQFLALHAQDEEPFFLMHSFGHVHTPMFSAPHRAGKSKHGRYGDNVEEMDESVGGVLAALKEYGLEDNTLVYFTSDQGGHLEAVDTNGERIGGHNGKFKGGKRQGGSEGGIRVPGIFRFPGRIPRGATLQTPTSLMDLFPTLLSMAHLPPVQQLVPRAAHKDLDGQDISELIAKGDKSSRTSRVFLHYCGTSIHAVRKDTGQRVYKMHLARPKWWEGSTQCGWHHTTACDCLGENVTDLSSRPDLYDLTADPYEDRPLSPDTPEYKKVVGELQEHVKEWKKKVPIPPSQLTTLANGLWKPLRQPYCLTC